jgi:hypothetical protein
MELLECIVAVVGSGGLVGSSVTTAHTIAVVDLGYCCCLGYSFVVELSKFTIFLSRG